MALSGSSSILLGIFLIVLNVHSAEAQCSGKPYKSGNGEWVTNLVPCTNSGRGYSGSSGGGSNNNAAAAIGAAGLAIGILGEIIENAERQEQASRNEAERQAAAARRAYCNNNWQQGDRATRQGNTVLRNNMDPVAAMTYYNTAIALFQRCGDRANIAIISKNMDVARRHAAAIKDDNRVSEARSKYSDSQFYGSGANNPFGNQKVAAVTPSDNPESRVRIHPVDVYYEAKKLCDGPEENSLEFKNCMSTEQARLILEADPNIRSVCQWDRDANGRNACAYNKFMAAWNGKRNPNGSGNIDVTWDQNGKPIYRKEHLQESGLRAALRKKLQDNSAKPAGSITCGNVNGTWECHNEYVFPQKQAVVDVQPAASAAAEPNVVKSPASDTRPIIIPESEVTALVEEMRNESDQK